MVVEGNKDKEHITYVESNGKYFQFSYDGYEGVSCDKVIAFLKFLGHKVFVVHKKLNEILPYVNWRDFV